MNETIHRVVEQGWPLTKQPVSKAMDSWLNVHARTAFRLAVQLENYPGPVFATIQTIQSCSDQVFETTT